MNKYRIRIEQLDYDHNLRHQHQVEISEDMIREMEKTHDIDALDKLWEQLKYEFFHHLNKEKQNQALIEMMQNDEEVGLYNLSKEDVEQIIKTCELSPNPNETLRRAAKRYKDGLNK
jgi:Mg/Co/Ni transporter MgtE